MRHTNDTLRIMSTLGRRTATVLAVLTFSALGVIPLAGCKSSSVKPENPSNPAQPIRSDKPDARSETITRLGVLRGGYMGIGGEHTGWVLKPSDDGVPATEVDVTKVFNDAAALDGSRVRITGTLITKKYVERGPVEILVASAIERAP